MNDGVVYLISYLVTPIVLGIAGLVSWRFPPKYGENVGYRTQRSKSSEAAWNFAQVFWGRLILIISIPVLACRRRSEFFRRRTMSERTQGW